MWLHAQARDGESPTHLSDLKTLLGDHLRVWPGSETTTTVRPWLVKILVAEGDLASAAEVADSLEAWQRAYLDADSSDNDFQPRFATSIKSWRSNRESRQSLNEAIATIADFERLPELGMIADQVATLPTGDRSSHSEVTNDFFIGVIRSRRTGLIEASFDTPPIDTPELSLRCLEKRMMTDARMKTSFRPSVAHWIATWVDRIPGVAEDSLAHAERLLWIGKEDEAISKLNELIAESPTSRDRIRQAADLLAHSSSPRAHEVAVQYFDTLAGGVPKGSDAWHAAKTRGIEVLAKMDKNEEARRRAEYILLTTPMMDAGHKRTYQQLAR